MHPHPNTIPVDRAPPYLSRKVIKFLLDISLSEPQVDLLWSSWSLYVSSITTGSSLGSLAMSVDCARGCSCTGRFCCHCASLFHGEVIRLACGLVEKGYGMSLHALPSPLGRCVLLCLNALPFDPDVSVRRRSCLHPPRHLLMPSTSSSCWLGPSDRRRVRSCPQACRAVVWTRLDDAYRHPLCPQGLPTVLLGPSSCC
ncbi:hypothetical protein OG21DRAFT_849993 [Imleria badia]|nr:hypothetical protein OG21DRAFT_849993 [Imleria badia]